MEDEDSSPLETTKLVPEIECSTTNIRDKNQQHQEDKDSNDNDNANGDSYVDNGNDDNFDADDERDNILSDILNETGIISVASPIKPRSISRNFIFLSILFSANHGAVVSCLSLATAKLGDLGTYSSSMLYLSYTLSALFGATYVVKNMGAKRAIIVGMGIYCVYVACFVVATIVPDWKQTAALIGAFTGGIGGGFLWTAQGSYFARASEEYAMAKCITIEDATSLFGGLFAGIYLSEEVVMRLFSTIMLSWGWSWVAVFVGYTIIALVSAFLMVFVNDYPISEEEQQRNDSQSVFYKSTVTLRLMVNDPKMKWMIPLSATFALSSVLIGTFVNAEVLRVALSDSGSKYVGVLTSISAAVGGIMSVAFGFASPVVGNQAILVVGCASFFMLSALFLTYPVLESWNLLSLILVYALQGVGRATFESTLKAEFAVVFQEKEAAFGNIIFQNGLVTSIGFILAAKLRCSSESTYCIKYHDGNLHNIRVFELLVMTSAILAVAGYRRARVLYRREKEEHEMEAVLLGEDHLL
uniref:Major facilitator superfamily (MFS) profile domain-containing protein n=1 Tax=Chaetoceros debilis TaxID=122233 RepID=A0A7S3Q7P5_9STRA|mmetsp:Transcript_30379/g.46500  ORF Transcript_30379/g.46500 Transcript_30379/m.46500 type:complete len:528 (+) Transcript_30379:195-1778(+)|eukprot:CAMPEP_0194119266 /NCGR_PEP_ID=MMETSP0150-20130528/38612_1 /TAXON_ID=122233 /ORGANISM="Chaetoceros debilis, Strain MM31A-1" /LENGTH=527 /DNA_ID=CAMNT_0038810901 /DNA_START=97 /DNA_END=1680 /DNA_ORIENTATION=+